MYKNLQNGKKKMRTSKVFTKEKSREAGFDVEREGGVVQNRFILLYEGRT